MTITSQKTIAIIHVAQDRNKWQFPVNMVKALWDP
jgi:hypothetical protein